MEPGLLLPIEISGPQSALKDPMRAGDQLYLGRGKFVSEKKSLNPIDRIEKCIFLIRGNRVILDADLASFYGVPTRRLNEQVKRNIDRFPVDFSFQLNDQEKAEVIANCDHLSNLKYSSSLPLAFTEHGAIMAANVLNSPRAVEMGVFVVRAFVSLRQAITSHQELTNQLLRLEKRLLGHDQQLLSIVRALKTLLGAKSIPKKRRIGFNCDDGGN